MAMIKCPECGKDMSDKAAMCPNCGCPIEEIRSQLGEIENKCENKKKAKEDEKKAKQIVAEIKKKKRAETRKSVTPEIKKRRIITGVAIVVFLMAVCIAGWYFGIKVPRDKAYTAYMSKISEYTDEANKYNQAIEAYNNRAKEVIAINDSFDSIISDAQALVNSGEEPYEGAKLTVLSNTLKDARNNKAKIPELEEIYMPISVETEAGKMSTKDLYNAIENYDEEMVLIGSKRTEIDAKRAQITNPDYSGYISLIQTQSKELEDSIAIQRQITQPSEEWVIARLGRVENIAGIAPVTEEHDPNGHLNKDGGYTATVYFMSPLLGTENITGDAIVSKGTIGGGAIEVYRCLEDVQKRDKYLGALDGGILASGSHTILGTMLIRTSDDLKASQQETLTNAIIAAMIEPD